MDYFQYRACQRLSKFLPSEGGASAIEFALLAPVLVIALLGTVDIGRALTDRLSMGSLLRTGAQAAIAGADKTKIEQLLQVAREDASVALTVERNCACPENPQAAVECSTTCAGPAPTAIYYLLTAKKEFLGMFLPGIPLSRTLSVQVR